jgi:hypothetical protein
LEVAIEIFKDDVLLSEESKRFSFTNEVWYKDKTNIYNDATQIQNLRNKLINDMDLIGLFSPQQIVLTVKKLIL